jgi:UDP-N-acetylglucosamine 4-epimerase
VMNLATGDQTSLNELVDLLREFTGCDVAPIYLDPRPGDIKHSLANVGKAHERLGYETIVPFRAGLQRTVEWYTERYGGSPD